MLRSAGNSRILESEEGENMGLQINRGQCLSPLPHSRGPAVLKSSDPLVWSAVVYPRAMHTTTTSTKALWESRSSIVLISALPASAQEISKEHGSKEKDLPEGKQNKEGGHWPICTILRD